MTSRLPRLRKLLEFFNHAGPTATVVLARLWILSETAMGYFHVRPGCGGRESQRTIVFFWGSRCQLAIHE
jgi:hypothetical protein